MKIKKTLRNQTVTETQEAVFSLELTHAEVKGAQWIKNGVELQTSDKYEVTCDGMVHTLKVKNCNTQDESVYSFKLGKLSASSRLNVESKLPLISTILMTILQKPDHMLTCFNLFLSYKDCEEDKRCDITAGFYCVL